MKSSSLFGDGGVTQTRGFTRPCSIFSTRLITVLGAMVSIEGCLALGSEEGAEECRALDASRDDL